MNSPAPWNHGGDHTDQGFGQLLQLEIISLETFSIRRRRPGGRAPGARPATLKSKSSAPGRPGGRAPGARASNFEVQIVYARAPGTWTY